MSFRAQNPQILGSLVDTLSNMEVLPLLQPIQQFIYHLCIVSSSPYNNKF